MRTITCSKGLSLPWKGKPESTITHLKSVRHVGLVSDDYTGLKPTFHVAAGDSVKKGQTLFEDKKNPGVFFTSPVSGVVKEIVRGEKRAFRNIAIEVTNGAEVSFVPASEPEAIRKLIIDSGLYTSFIRRPFGKIPPKDERPSAIFVTAMDTRPGAPDMSIILQGREQAFLSGVRALGTMTDGKVFVCCAPESLAAGLSYGQAEVVTFAGKHPAGLAGTHAHFLRPATKSTPVWSVDMQDVIAIGNLVVNGVLDTTRVYSVTGEGFAKPCLVRAPVGTAIAEIICGEMKDGFRLVSGSVLYGRAVTADAPFAGRYHQQISSIKEHEGREFMGWAVPGFTKFSLRRIFASRLLGASQFDISTAMHGSYRAMIPIGMFEDVMPLDILPTMMLRAITVNDVEQAEQLGCLELLEEDLSLCTFVSPGKEDFGPMLRSILTTIEKEG